MDEAVLLAGVEAPPLDPLAPPPPLTPEQFAALPHDDKGPHLNATIWTLIGISAAFLATRVYCKFLRHRGLWWDDWILIASWICITTESALLSYAVSLSYGKHIWDMNPDPLVAIEMLKVINAAGTLSLIAAVWSKTSFALTLLRLIDGGWMRYLLWFIIVSMNIAMGLSALFIYVQCTPIERAWNPFIPGQCWPPYVLVNYDIFSAAYSAAGDITLAMLPWKLIWGLQMKKQEKIGVAVAMSCGVFAGVTAIIKTTKIPHMLSFDPADGVELFIWGNAESCVTIVAASIPILRVLIREVSSSARRRYYYSNENAHTGPEGTGRRTKLRSQTNTVITGGPRSRIDRVGGGGESSASKTDDWSDKSILEGRTSPGKIMQTNEVNVSYADRKDGESIEYEMGHMSPV